MSFRIGVPGEGPRPGLYIGFYTLQTPLDRYADVLTQTARRTTGSDVTLVSDKPSQLRDGTPAREVEYSVTMNGVLVYVMGLAVKRGDLQVLLSVSRRGERVGEDLKAVLYSLQFQPGKDDPIEVSPDIRQFLDTFCNDLVSHDVARVMAHYSDRYLESGQRKGEAEHIWRLMAGFLMSFQIGVADVVVEGDRVHLAGFFNSNGVKTSIHGSSIIKENGKWKWYGNQRDPLP
jgi:hypothetical protein